LSIKDLQISVTDFNRRRRRLYAVRDACISHDRSRIAKPSHVTVVTPRLLIYRNSLNRSAHLLRSASRLERCGRGRVRKLSSAFAKIQFAFSV